MSLEMYIVLSLLGLLALALVHSAWAWVARGHLRERLQVAELELQADTMRLIGLALGARVVLPASTGASAPLQSLFVEALRRPHTAGRLPALVAIDAAAALQAAAQSPATTPAQQAWQQLATQGQATAALLAKKLQAIERLRTATTLREKRWRSSIIGFITAGI